MADPTAIVDTDPVATFGGEPVPAGPVSVRVFCAPTYALSHRWGWPDENGVMRCACGSEKGHLSEQIACSIHSMFWSTPWRPGVETPFVWLNDFQERFAWAEMLSEPHRHGDEVEAERQRCERLGVEWVGPDVQEMPNGDEERIEAFLRGHGVTVAEFDSALNNRWARAGIVQSDLEELRSLDEGRAESPRWLMMSAYADSGGIHRLGCELREANGVTAR